jgi:hypothetical protein
MPRAIPVPIRRAIVERCLAGQGLDTIALGLDLPYGTDRSLWRPHRLQGEDGPILGPGSIKWRPDAPGPACPRRRPRDRDRCAGRRPGNSPPVAAGSGAGYRPGIPGAVDDR